MDSFLTQGIEDSSATPHETGKGSLGWKYLGQSGLSAFKIVDFTILKGRSKAEDEDHIFELQESRVPWDKALEGRGGPR